MTQKKQYADNNLSGKVAIVTGSASGIGYATTLLLKERRARVIAEDVNPAIEEILQNDERISPYVGDVAKEETALQIVAFSKQRFGKLEIRVNNAARIVNKPVLDITLDDWNSMLLTPAPQ